MGTRRAGLGPPARVGSDGRIGPGRSRVGAGRDHAGCRHLERDRPARRQRRGRPQLRLRHERRSRLPLPLPQRGGRGRPALRAAQPGLHLAGLRLRGLGHRRRRQRPDRVREPERRQPEHRGREFLLARSRSRDLDRLDQRSRPRRLQAPGDPGLQALAADRQPLRQRGHRQEHRHPAGHRPPLSPRHGLGHRADRVRGVGDQPGGLPAAALLLRRRVRDQRPAGRSPATPSRSRSVERTTPGRASSPTSAPAASIRPSPLPPTTAASSTSASVR